MKAYANSSERVYEILDRGQKKKGSGHVANKKRKLRLKRRFRAQEKEAMRKENY